ncbi:hypothetical protein Pcinc_037050 [Petrolisthes cinctipes]|uniref:Uncharacterized protein n=1 Tax=Petrolisthes cinctipes TaxID=88211 RepID=A0AAE1BUC1_PETCI|nr:hypothetical protein Pcinc_037050 [Petrolisthes cinctipes]
MRKEEEEEEEEMWKKKKERRKKIEEKGGRCMREEKEIKKGDKEGDKEDTEEYIVVKVYPPHRLDSATPTPLCLSLPLHSSTTPPRRVSTSLHHYHHHHYVLQSCLSLYTHTQHHHIAIPHPYTTTIITTMYFSLSLPLHSSTTPPRRVSTSLHHYHHYYYVLQSVSSLYSHSHPPTPLPSLLLCPSACLSLYTHPQHPSRRHILHHYHHHHYVLQSVSPFTLVHNTSTSRLHIPTPLLSSPLCPSVCLFLYTRPQHLHVTTSLSR